MTSVAVAGATGLVGRAVVAALRDGGHEPVEVSRAAGVDVVAGTGLDRALSGVSAVIDVLNAPARDADAAVAFFETAARNLIQTELRAGVSHHVLLSIVNIDRIEGSAHYAGKRAQERVVEAGPVPWTIQRATQFHDFAGTVVGWTSRDGVATVPPLLVQPVAVTDVAAVLVELATGAPRGRVPDLAGPETEDLVDMARRTLAVRGDATRLRASWRDGPFGVAWAGEVLLPGPGGRLGPTTFDTWLDLELARQLGGRVTLGPVLRAAATGDLPVLRGVFRRASLDNAGDRDVLLAHPEVLVWSGEAIAGGRVRVAVDGGRVVGFATTVPIEGGLELEDLFVEPDRMRHGVGRRLVADVLDIARSDGVEHVWVTANPHAMAFYTAVGFVPDGTTSTRFGPAPRLRLDVPSGDRSPLDRRGDDR